jgi:O-succinylbenzoic acid--CoA ligase
MTTGPSAGRGEVAGSGVADFLAEAVESGAEGIALVTPERAWSYPELSSEVDERAAELVSAGAVPGAVHPVALEADGVGTITLLALWRVGAVPAPLNPRLTEAERAQAEDLLRAGGAVRPNSRAGTPATGATHPQAVLWTSGTSGRPRGVAISADNLRASARGAAARLELGPSDVWLASLSVAHVGGLAMVVRSLLLGGALVAWGRFAAPATAALLDGQAIPHGAPGPVTHLSLVPTQLLHLLDLRGDAPPPPSLRCALVGGAHAPPELVRRALDAGWPLALTYGMTEMTSQVATATPGQVRRKPGASGRPLDGIDLRLSDDGEVLVRGPMLALGTVGAGADGGGGTLVPLAQYDGWYRTGDLGRLDGDGDLWITGRRSERIISGGVNVDPHEVEAVLRGFPAVADACVVGLPDPEWGEVVAAVVVPVEGAFDADAAGAWSRERLAPPKRPRRWLPVDALPLNANGKVDRGAVRALFA